MDYGICRLLNHDARYLNLAKHSRSAPLNVTYQCKDTNEIITDIIHQNVNDVQQTKFFSNMWYSKKDQFTIVVRFANHLCEQDNHLCERFLTFVEMTICTDAGLAAKTVIETIRSCGIGITQIRCYGMLVVAKRHAILHRLEAELQSCLPSCCCSSCGLCESRNALGIIKTKKAHLCQRARTDCKCCLRMSCECFKEVSANKWSYVATQELLKIAQM